MASLVKDLIEAGIHFGQRRSNWNPKMTPYIFGVRHRIHIIDLRQTIKGLLVAKKFITRVVAEGKDICFVGTKRQARAAIEKHAQDVKMPYVTERWIGGTLTNFRTIRERLGRLDELERLVETGELDTYSKKMGSQLLREKRKITRNLQGIRDMTKLPGCLVVFDVNREINALREARTLDIPTVCLIDTDGDPDMVDIPIPGNDDSMRSIEVIMRELANAVRQGLTGRPTALEPVDEGPSSDRRRSTRVQYSATGAPPSEGPPPIVESAEAVAPAPVATTEPASD